MGEPMVDSAPDAPAAVDPAPAAAPDAPSDEPASAPGAPSEAPAAPDGVLDQGAALEHVTVDPFPVPSFAAMVCFAGVVFVLLAVIGWAYLLGAPLGAMVVPGATAASPSSLVAAVHRVAAGGPHVAHVVISSPQGATGMFVSVTFLLALLVGQCVEHSAWYVGLFLVRVLWRALRSAVLGTGRAVRRTPHVLHGLAFVAVSYILLTLANAHLRGVDATPTPARVQSLRAAFEAVPLPPAVRREVHRGCLTRHNVAFLNFLDSDSTCELACDLGHC